MIMNEQALIILTDSDIVNAAETGLFFCQREEQGGDCLGNFCGRVITGKQPLRLGLNVAFNFDTGTKLGAYRVFKLRGVLVRFHQWHKAIYFQIKAHGQPAFDFLNREVVDGQIAARGDKHHTLEHGFIVKRHGIHRNRHISARKLLHDLLGQRVLQLDDVINRHGARHLYDHTGKKCGPRRSQA